MKCTIGFVYLSVCCALFIGCRHDTPVPVQKPEWTNLLDTNLSYWEKFIGVPHYTVPLEGYPKGDGMNGIPIGLNNDPLEVYKVEVADSQPVLHISGQVYGGLTTQTAYSNYHLRLEFRWGEKKYEPRLNMKRDNGILYHAYGNHGAFWNVWMRSQEFQVQETDMGDYFALGPGGDIRAAYRTEDGETDWIYDPTTAPEGFAGNHAKSRCRRSVNNEKPTAEWNTLELICLGRKSLHIVNGKVVMALDNSRIIVSDSLSTPLERGRIQIQSEGAEAYYRNIFIRQITEIPGEYKSQVTW